jgi:phosphohistidine phosphatase
VPAASVAVPAATQPEDAGDGSIELYFLRHADAGDPLTWVGDDFERPLSKKGRRQAKRLGRLLAGLGTQVDVVLSSPLVRATETARLVARAIGTSWVADDRLGSGFGDDALRPLVAGLAPADSSVILVGHDPDFSRTVSWLVGASIEMRKGALARVSLPDRNVGAGRGSLRWLLPPDAVGR